MVFGTARAVKSHRTGRRRKKGGSRLPVAPWIVITLVCVLVASGLTWGFVVLMRSGCAGEVHRVTVATAPSLVGSLEDVAREWERGQPDVNGECVGVRITEVPAAEASRGITGEWDDKSFGPRPIAWVPDSQAWPAWIASSELTAGYVSSEPVVLGQASSVLAVSESKANELGWLGGQPPAWSDVVAAAAGGSISLAAANPRTSTEGLVAMLNATADESGAFSAEAMAAYQGAVSAGTTADDVDELFAAFAEAPDASQVFTALDYQLEDFDPGTEDPLVPVTPSGSSVNAVASYQVLGGAGWVSEGDAKVAGMFADHLRSLVDAGGFEDGEFGPVEDAGAAVAATSPEKVGAAVKAWAGDTRDLNVLVLVDRSSLGSELVEYEGGSIEASNAEIRVAVATVLAMESTYRAGLWEYGVDAGGEGAPWRSVTDLVEMSDDNAGDLENELWALSENDLHEGGSPLYDTLVDAYEYMGEKAVEGADNVIVVLTNSGTDEVSAPTVGETATALSDLAGQMSVPVSVYTVGFGEADQEKLTQLAQATGGAFIDAPADGGVLESLGGGLVN